VRRRTLLASTLGLLAAPIAAVAQSRARVHRIGLLGGSAPTSPEASHLWGAFLQGLRDLGYVDGQNADRARRDADGRSRTSNAR
jgi:hypothetical protein